MTAVASEITSLTIVYSTVYSGADQRKHQSSASLAFVMGTGLLRNPHVKSSVNQHEFWNTIWNLIEFSSWPKYLVQFPDLLMPSYLLRKLLVSSSSDALKMIAVGVMMIFQDIFVNYTTVCDWPLWWTGVVNFLETSIQKYIFDICGTWGRWEKVTSDIR